MSFMIVINMIVYMTLVKPFPFVNNDGYTCPGYK